MNERKSRIEELPAGGLETDPRVNPREISPKWVTERIRKFSMNKLGVITVSQREPAPASSGKPVFIILDGQHRRELVIEAAGRDTLVRCDVYEGLSLAEEAGMFLDLNDDRKPDAVAGFLARVTRGDITAGQVLAITARYGWKIGPDPKVRGTLTCVVRMERIHHNDKAKSGKPMALERTLQTITEAWSPGLQPACNGNGAVAPGAGHQALVGGIGAIYLAHGDAVDIPRLTVVLATWRGGPGSLLSKAKGLQDAKGGDLAKCVKELVLILYNKDLKSRKLL